MNHLIKPLSKNPLHILLLICLLGLILRLLGIINTVLAGDFKVFWHVSGEIVTKGIFPLLGPSASVNTSFHLGPFYYYFMTIPYVLGFGDYHAGIVFFCVLNTFSIAVLYFTLKHWFTISQSLKMTALYALSSYMITIQSFPWNPYIIPFFIIMALYCVTQIQKGKYLFVPLLSLIFGLSIQLHATVIFLIPVFLLLLPLKTVSAKYYLLAIVTFFLPLTPWIYSDVTTNLSQTKAGFAIFASTSAERCSLSHYIENHGNGERCFSQIRNTLFLSRLFTMSLFGSRNLTIVIFTLAALVFTLLKVKLKHKKLIFLWVLIPYVFFLFYSSNIYLHYFIILIPIPYILAILLLEKLEKKGRYGKMASNLLFLALLIFNIVQFIFSLDTLRG